MLSLEEPRGSSYNHLFTYNRLNSLAGYQPPPMSGGYYNSNYAYDVDGLLVSAQPPTVPVSYTRDESGRVSQVSYNHPVSGTVVATTTYDSSSGRACTSASGSCATQRCATNGPDGNVLTTDTYDGPLLLSEKTTVSSPSFNHAVYWSYDSAFRVSTRSLDSSTCSASSACATFGYTEGSSASDSLLSSVTLGGDTHTVTRSTTGLVRCTSTSGGTGVCDTYAYNAYGEVTAYAVYSGACTTSCGHSGTALYNVSYTRDTSATGRIVSKTEYYNGYATCTRGYTYDTSGTQTFLTGVTLSGHGCSGTTTYTYDANGNDSTVSYWNYDDQDRQFGPTGTSWTYAASGSASSQTIGSHVITYGYDPLGHMRHFNDSLYNTSFDYLFDVNNRRIYRYSYGSQQSPNYADSRGWLYDGERIIAEVTTSSNTLQSHFIYVTKPNVPDLMLRYESGSWILYRIVSDILGTVKAVVKVSTGAVAEGGSTYVYNDDFGGITVNPTYQPFGFAGGLLDDWMGMVHFGARDYSGWQRRWMNKDPIRFGGGPQPLHVLRQRSGQLHLDPSGLSGDLIECFKVTPFLDFSKLLACLAGGGASNAGGGPYRGDRIQLRLSAIKRGATPTMMRSASVASAGRAH